MGEAKLPPRGHRRVAALIKRSQPNRSRPRMPTEYEDALRESDEELATCYAAMEDLGASLDDLIVELDGDGVVLEPFDDDDSAVTHIEEVADELDELSARVPRMRAAGDE